MNIHEYQAKQILSRYGVRIPLGKIAYTPGEAKRVAENISHKGPWMLKAQIQSGARESGHFIEKRAGVKGGIRCLKGHRDVLEEAAKMLGATLVTDQTGAKGKLVSKIYVEEFCLTVQKFYASLVIDRMLSCITLLVANTFGNITALAQKEPEKILRLNLGLNEKISAQQAMQISAFLHLKEKSLKPLKELFDAMLKAFTSLDAVMIEINPVGVCTDGSLTALDAKIAFDDNALFRHPEILPLKDDYEEDDRSLQAQKFGFQYLDFDEGSIGCIVNGDGLALSVRDLLYNADEKMSCFLNVKGGVDKDKISAGIKIIMTNPRVEGILINILGGFLRCNLVADGIVSAASEVGLNVPLVVRFEGTNKEEAKEILKNSGLPVITAENMEDSVEKLLTAMKEAA